MDNGRITRIFCDAGDFCAGLGRYRKARLLQPSGRGGRWLPRSRLTPGGVMTVVILFHLGGCRCFKWYYRECVGKRLSGYFPRPVSYNRFAEPMSRGALTRRFIPGSFGGGSRRAPALFAKSGLIPRRTVGSRLPRGGSLDSIQAWYL
jgi:hypothetical protein